MPRVRTRVRPNDELLSRRRQPVDTTYVPAYAFALAYVGLGQKDESFMWLNKEIDEHGTAGASIGVDPMIYDLRFKEALKRVKLAP